MQTTQHLGKYRLLAEIGHGGMAKVYLAVVHGPAGFNKLVVVKEIHTQLAEEPEFITMFQDEARLAARLNHPNIVQTNEVGEDQGHHYMAMEYLEGQTYNRVFQRLGSRLPLAVQLRLICEVLAGLEYAHNLKDFDGSPLGVVHRDISPHNVFVTYSGQVKVMDFGIAKAMNSNTETRSGMLKGKPTYMAPEQAASKRVDRRADLFAVGVMLWEAVAGRRMHKGENEIVVLQRLLKGDVPRAAAAGVDVPPQLEAIIDRALSPDPEGRFATAAELQAELEMFLATVPDQRGMRDLGKLMAAEFATDREKIQLLIEQQLSRGPLDENSQLPMIEAPTSTYGGVSGTGSGASNPSLGTSPSVASGSSPGLKSSQTRVSFQQASQPAPAPVPQAKINRLWVALAALATAGLVAAVVVGFARRREPEGASASTASAKSFTVRVETRPPGATIRDGDRVLGATPLSVSFAADGAPHELVALKDGFQTHTFKVPSLSSDLSLEAALVATGDADASADPQPKGTASGSAGPSKKEPRAGTGGGTKRPPATSTPTSSPGPSDIRLTR